jgi:hypothetical protein
MLFIKKARNYPFAGSPGIQEENNFQATINASLSVDISNVQPNGSDPKQSNLTSPVCCGRIIKDLFPPIFELIDKVVPRTFTFFTWKCITCPPWYFKLAELFQVPESRSLKPSESVLSVASEFCLSLLAMELLSVDVLLLSEASLEEDVATDEASVEEDEESEPSSVPELSPLGE